MTRHNRRLGETLIAVAAACSVAGAAMAQTAPKYAAKPPASILTPDTVETRIGTLKFNDGVPDAATIQKAYDQLDFGRGIEAFIAGVPAASIYGLCEGFKSIGAAPNEGFGVSEDRVDARTLMLTPNATTVYVIGCFDLTKGPVVFEMPPGALGMIDDAYFRYVTDVGATGPDQGRGGKYLLLPPNYSSPVPEGYFPVKSRSNTNWTLFRMFVTDGNVKAAVEGAKLTRVYPLSQAADPPATKLVNSSGVQFNQIHANDFHFYEELNAVVQREPADFIEPETIGLFGSIGIKKGKPFEPNPRMKAILTDAVAVANAATRATIFAPRDPRAYLYKDRRWYTTFYVGGSQFIDNGERALDARAMFHYYATGITPAMVNARPGTGSAYAIASRDTQDRFFDGGKTYKVNLPAPIPAKQFWSFTVYDNQTRSMLETDQKSAGVDSNQPGMKKNPDGSVMVWFSPKPPPGQENNWVQTRPGKGWNTLFRLYGPLEPWFDKAWKPGDFERVD